MEKSPRFSIIIVGAGVAGMTAAIALSRKGHTVTLLDSRKETQGRLANNNVFYPNATRVWAEFGLMETLLPLAATRSILAYRRFDTNGLVRIRDVGDFVTYYDYPHMTMFREDYVPILLTAVIKNGVTVRLGENVVNVDEASTTVVLGSGEVLHADLIVGADGIRSITRKAVISEDVPLTPSPVNAYISRIPRSIIEAMPESEQLLNESVMWLGRGRIVLGTPIGDLYDLSLAYPADPEAADELYKETDLNEMKSYYKDYHPIVKRIIDQIETSKTWKLLVMGSLTRWVSDSGRVVIVGDAAHAMLPSKGQGASQGIEDGAALAECLERAKSIGDIPCVLKAFEEIRKPRTEKVQKSSEDFLGQLTADKTKERKRDEDMKKETDALGVIRCQNMDDSAAKKKASDEILDGWLVGYDVFRETNKQLDILFGHENHIQAVAL